MFGNPSAQCQTKLRNLFGETCFGPLGQEVGTLHTADDGLDDGSPTGAENITGYRVEFQTGIFQNLGESGYGCDPSPPIA